MPPMQRAMSGPDNAAPPLKQEPTHQPGCANAGIAAVPTFIWTSHARWRWAFAIGPKNSQLKKDEENNN